MIILLGFPKSGTSSFQKLFTNLGYKSYHQDKQSKKIAMLIKNNKLNGIFIVFNIHFIVIINFNDIDTTQLLIQFLHI